MGEGFDSSVVEHLLFLSPAQTYPYLTEALMRKKWGELPIFEKNRLDFKYPRAPP
jgi:hypothetical protein